MRGLKNGSKHNRCLRVIRPLFLIVLGCGLCAGAGAQALDEAARRVSDCRAIPDAVERLACFDSESEALAVVLAEPSAGPAETPAAPGWADAPAEKAPAGTAADESVPIWARVFPRTESPETPDEIQVTVVRILRNNVGRHFFFTSDGQEWEQVVAEGVRPPEALPAEATISESLFGSPKLTFDDGPSGSYGVRRVE